MILLELQAKNDKEAIDMASGILEVSPENFTAEVFKKGGGNFLGLGGKKPSLFHVLPTEKATQETLVKGVIISLLSNMGYQVEILQTETLEDGKFYVELASQNAGNIIGKKGKTLEALQFVVNIIIEKHTGAQPKILLDIEKYRDRRAKQLSDIAIKMARQVIKTGKSRLLDPLNPYERRLVHMALQENEEVLTESEGSGVYKRIRISAKKKGEKNPVLEELSEEVSDYDDFADPEDYENIQKQMAETMNDDEPAG